MGIISFITDLFESIFMASSPEVKKKQALKKIDSELRSIQPCIYKNGMLQPNFAELFRVLYENTKPLDDLLSATISSDDVKCKGRYENQLLLTGFTGVNQEKLENLNADHRKQEVMDSSLPINRVFDNQRHTLEYLIKELNTPEFIKIDEVIAALQQLTDLCRYNFLTVIHSFDPEYSNLNPGYKPSFYSCAPDSMAASFQDLYYLTAKFKITNSLGRAVVALVQIKQGGKPVESLLSDKYLGYLRKIHSVLTKYLTPDVLLKLIRLSKREPDFIPQIASYKVNARQNFANYLQDRFKSDETRIKSEIKDNTIAVDVRKLFGNQPMQEINGYNAENSARIQMNCTKAYNWITPVQVIKTFIAEYFDEKIRQLLDDIVIEGFFENQTTKTEFSSAVYACVESIDTVDRFEKSFERNGRNDQAIIDGYIRDGRKDVDFIKKLEASVDNINEQAHQLVQEVAAQFYALYKQIGELLIDSKKTKPDLCSNIKVLLSSSRNRENSSKLETQFENWAVFLDIMKNYAIIGEVERK